MSNQAEPLAHSARKSVPEQSYKKHIEAVIKIATDNAQRAANYFQGDREYFVEAVRVAALYHDLGKLDEENQRVLMRSATEALPLNHVDAGAARLLELRRMESSLLAFAHHIGLPSLGEQARDGRELFLRDRKLASHTDDKLAEYLTQHDKVIGQSVFALDALKAKWSGLTRRVALSCLVDGDHTDTAEHYGNEQPAAPLPLRPAERLGAMDDYVNQLAGNDKQLSSRNQIRQKIYLACRDAPTNVSILACDSPVGTGKTTAILAHLLSAAYNKGLRRVFVVLPYTNIIKQSVDVYRQSLTLDGENPEEVVAEHHHQADFSSREFRHLAQLWNAPIVVTTAVQFFETLGNHHPARLRKLHEIAGSAILVDEAHAAMPTHLWPQMWLWLRELTDNWGCHIVLASGSLVRFWKMEDFVDPPQNLPELVSEEVRKQAVDFESRRVIYKTHEVLLSLSSLLGFILSKPGPRLVILNTVQSAAVVADALRKRNEAVFHLSTALCPIHRSAIVNKIKERLKNQQNTNWTLVATSCVEAGMDFSFRTAFRESCGLVNLIQIGGRVNRSGEYGDEIDVWDFRILDSSLSLHPAFEDSRAVLGEMFAEGLVDAQSATEALRREAQRNQVKLASERLKLEERQKNYPEVAKLCRVINTDTRTVVVDPNVIRSLETRLPMPRATVMLHSVQIWSSKLDKLPTAQLQGTKDLWKWVGSYDPTFLGYMEGVIQVQDSSSFII